MPNSDQPTTMASATPQQRIKQLASFGNQVTVDANMPIKRYYRSGMEMVRMAAMYQKEGNLENAYILYVKFMTLFLEKILVHPEYKAYPAPAKRANQTRLRETMPIAEQVRVQLEQRFEREHQLWLADDQRRRAEEEAAAEEQRRRQQQQQQQHQQQQRDIVAAAAHAADRNRHEMPSAPSPLPQDDGPNAMTDLLARVDLDQVVYPNDFPPAANRAHAPGGLLLPESAAAAVPARPAIDRRLKPSPMAASTSNESLLLQGHLRLVLVPADTMQRFLALAARNTAANVETCGILAGRMAQNRLIITHIIVPKQHGTADSCTTMNEEDIFDVQDQQNLITLGWIHTHPSQTAFLSSVDLHTHCSYQIMMPEALAIVCAPKYKTTGFFCLTPGYGLDYIAGCRQSGFHPHPNEPPLFMEAEHVRLDEDARVQVVDLRK